MVQLWSIMIQAQSIFGLTLILGDALRFYFHSKTWKKLVSQSWNDSLIVLPRITKSGHICVIVVSEVKILSHFTVSHNFMDHKPNMKKKAYRESHNDHEEMTLHSEYLEFMD